MEAIINAYLNERIGYRDMLRKLISYKQWLVPVLQQDGEQRPNLVRHNEQIFLLVYSSAEQVPPNTTTMTIDGNWLFSQLESPIDTLVIDPQAPYALQFPKEKFSTLKEWAQTLYIESLLEKEEFDAHTLKELLEFQGYFIPLVESESGVRHITLAPDQQQRKLAAVFTAEDALSLYVQNAQGALGKQLLIDRPEGKKLFAYLLQLPIEGIVFNCYGPGTPRALAKESLQSLLTPLKENDS